MDEGCCAVCSCVEVRYAALRFAENFERFSYILMGTDECSCEICAGVDVRYYCAKLWVCWFFFLNVITVLTVTESRL